MLRRLFFLLALVVLPALARADTPAPSGLLGAYWSTAGCTPGIHTGQPGPRVLLLDPNGLLCVTGSGAGGAVVATTSPATRTLVTLAIKTVTTGGTAVTAIAAGGRTAGGWIFNPGAIPLCINEIGTASGTTSSGDTTCVAQNVKYTLTPSGNAVSVVSSDSSHPFSGYGLQ